MVIEEQVLQCFLSRVLSSMCAVVGGQQQLYFYPPQQGANNVVESITVEFESAVSGLTISNFALSKNGVAVPLTAAQYSSSSSHSL